MKEVGTLLLKNISTAIQFYLVFGLYRSSGHTGGSSSTAKQLPVTPSTPSPMPHTTVPNAALTSNPRRTEPNVTLTHCNQSTTVDNESNLPAPLPLTPSAPNQSTVSTMLNSGGCGGSQSTSQIHGRNDPVHTTSRSKPNTSK